MATESFRHRSTHPQDEEATLEGNGTGPSANGRPRDSHDVPEHRSLLLDHNEKPVPVHEHHHFVRERAGFVRFSDRFLRKGKTKVGTVQSLKNVFLSSCKCLDCFILMISSQLTCSAY